MYSFLKKSAPFILGIVFLFFLFLIFKEGGKQNFTLPALTPTKYQEVDLYFALVTNFKSLQKNISFEGLKKIANGEKEQELLIPKENEKPLKNILGIDKWGKKVKVVETKSIQDALAKNETLAILPFDQIDFKLKTLKVDSLSLWDKSQITSYPLKVKEKVKEKDLKNNFDPSKIITFTAVGDIILGRTVAKKMSELGFLSPFLNVASRLKGADLTFADLETPLSDQVAPPYEGMSFIAPSGAIQGIEASGIDIVSLANNHSTNFGENVFLDTLNLLKSKGIKYVGGGENINEAKKIEIVEAGGLKFAFLNYNSIIGAISATQNSPGVANFSLKPWGEDNPQDLSLIKEKIKEAKTKADIVIVVFHWGVEYTLEPILSQVNLAHEAIDSGADMVIGTHPHWIQTIEFYKEKPIFYSLGNFIFDQEWSLETKQGLILETAFYNKRLVNMELVPIQIENYHQPRILDDKEQAPILEKILKSSNL